ncbi:nucleoside hydrolase [Puniceicoccaceae bacterium K14]|nr:nucleoside hydrolase [Puniceicoccaceae bacterium K14]
MYKVIIDSDWGGDVLQLSCVLATKPDEYEIIGATVTFGNASLAQNVRNAGSMLRLMGMDHQIPVCVGAVAPSGQTSPPKGDNAHGNTGLGEAILEYSAVPPSKISAVDFILEQVGNEPSNSIILIATGPQSNIAQAIQRDPDIMRKLKEIRIMGGCIRPLCGYRVDEQLNRISEEPIQRYGNITEFAEFNFQQAPEDAATVLNSGIPIALFPMDCTHQMCFTDQRQAMLEKALSGNPKLIKQLVDMCSGPRKMDKQKFEISPTLHDAHTTISMLRPDLYTGNWGKVDIITDPDSPQYGKTEFRPEKGGSHLGTQDITDSDAAYKTLVDSLLSALL